MRDDRRPYVDRPVTDLVAATALAERAAAHWGLTRPALLRRGMNAIFATERAVLRVSAPSADPTSSILLAQRLADAGLRVTRPQRDDVVVGDELSVTCWERIERTDEPIDWAEVGAMVRVVHDLDPAVIPLDYPMPPPTRFPWWEFERLLDEVGDDLDDAARSGLVEALHRWPDWRALRDPVVCHGDVHPGNVIMTDDGPVLIDWDLLCHAPAGWDHAPLMTWTERWGGPVGMYDAFAAGYGASLRGDPDAEAFAELRLVAATLLRLLAARANPAAAPEARRRLAYWRGDPAAPTWRAQ